MHPRWVHILLQTLDFWMVVYMFAQWDGSISCISAQLCVSDTMLHVITYSEYTLSLISLQMVLWKDYSQGLWAAPLESGKQERNFPGQREWDNQRWLNVNSTNSEHFFYLHFLLIWSVYKLGFIYLFCAQGQCMLINVSVSAPDLTQRLFFICSPWTMLQVFLKWNVQK